MGEFASNSKANAGLTTGIIGTTLGGLWALGAGNGGGILGNLLGGNASQMNALMAENAMLKSENYSDKIGKEVYSQSLADNRATEARINALLAPTATAIAENQKEIAVLKAKLEKDREIIQLKMDNCCCKLNSKIESVAQTAACGIQQNANAVASLQAVVASITKTIVPQSAICPEVMPRYNSWTTPTTTTPAA